MSISPPSPDGSTGITVLTLGSALTATSLTAPVVRSATSADWLSGPMIRPLVLSRQPCITPLAPGTPWGRAGRAAAAAEAARRSAAAHLGFGGERLGLACRRTGRSPTRPATPRTADEHTPHRPAQSHARQITDRSAVRATRWSGAASRGANRVRESAAPIHDSRVTCTYPGKRDQSPLTIHALGRGPTTRGRPRGPRRQAWSTPRTICPPRRTRATSRPPPSRATTRPSRARSTPGSG